MLGYQCKTYDIKAKLITVSNQYFVKHQKKRRGVITPVFGVLSAKATPEEAAVKGKTANYNCTLFEEQFERN